MRKWRKGGYESFENFTFSFGHSRGLHHELSIRPMTKRRRDVGGITSLWDESPYHISVQDSSGIGFRGRRLSNKGSKVEKKSNEIE